MATPVDMTHQYNLLLVALSVTIGIFASFVALSVSGRIADVTRAARRWWLAGAAISLGVGIWSMHFVGILAVAGSTLSTFDIPLTGLSLLIAIAGSAAGFAIVARHGTAHGPLAAGGTLVGAGVAAMHYVGMAAMHMQGMAISYDPLLVGASIAIAIVASTLALGMAFRPAGLRQQLAAAIVMGLAIAGMHYTGMAAAHSERLAQAKSVLEAGLDSQMLAIAVASIVGLLLLLALIVSYYDRRLWQAEAGEAAALRQSEGRFRTLLENASDIIVIVDRHGTIVYESSSALHVLGYRTDEVVGRQFTAFVQPDRRPAAEALFAAVLDLTAPPAALDITLLHRDGAPRGFEMVARNYLDEPVIAGIVMTLRDVTERNRLIDALQALSETDELTGMANRRGFLRRAEQALEQHRAVGTALQFVIFDIDHFKLVNDLHGHAAGDLVLGMVADLCRKLVRPTDLFCRWGGEEFALLLCDADEATADFVVARLRGALIQARVATISGKVGVTASFGIAAVQPGESGLEATIQRADEALYKAKREGRNRIRRRA